MTPGKTSIVDLDHLRSWIGRQEVEVDVVSVDLVRKFNALFDFPPSLPREGNVAPPLIHYCLAQPAALTSELGDDGHPKRGGFLPPIPLPRRMWAGSNLAFRGDLHVGDRVRRASRIADVSIKEGHTGVLCFVTVEHRLSVAGELKIEETQSIVYRRAEPAGSATKPTAPEHPSPVGTHSRPMPVSTLLLFRYSALTFNGHRIHYDQRYALEVERYPGLVVHGPLQATLLLLFARDLKGRTPSRFAFRGQSPLFSDDRINLHAADRESIMQLWTARENGPIAMSAKAEWE